MQFLLVSLQRDSSDLTHVFGELAAQTVFLSERAFQRGDVPSAHPELTGRHGSIHQGGRGHLRPIFLLHTSLPVEALARHTLKDRRVRRAPWSRPRFSRGSWLQTAACCGFSARRIPSVRRGAIPAECPNPLMPTSTQTPSQGCGTDRPAFGPHTAHSVACRDIKIQFILLKE